MVIEVVHLARFTNAVSFLYEPNAYHNIKLARSDNFAIEKGKAEKAINWMNSYAATKNKKFSVKLCGYSLSTVNFGDFEVVSWDGEWSAARHIIVKASSKLNMKVVESGYHSKSNILQSFFGLSKEYAKVFSGGVLVGNIILGIKSGRIIADSEKLV
jgi:hypothetical protein